MSRGRRAQVPRPLKCPLFHAQEPLSLDSHLSHDHELNLLDSLARQLSRPHEQVSSRLMKLDIQRLLHPLPAREAS